MKKLFLLFAFAMGSFVVCQAQDQAEIIESSETITYENEQGEKIETTKPILLFDKETHDFGEIEEGPKYDYTFSFQNIGKEPLIIDNVKASCGCTTPEWPKEPVMPGAEAEIKVIYNTKGRLNNFNKAITITSNAITPTKRLYIKGKVLKAEPEMPVKEKSLIEQTEDND